MTTLLKKDILSAIAHIAIQWRNHSLILQIFPKIFLSNNGYVGHL